MFERRTSGLPLSSPYALRAPSVVDRRRSWAIAIGVLSILLLSILHLSARPIRAGVPDDEWRRSFDEDVRPILVEHCGACHGPRRVKARLRLDSLDRVLAAVTSHELLVPGDAASSSLIERITLPADDPDRMPPEGKDPLTEEQIAVIRGFVDRMPKDALTTGRAEGREPEAADATADGLELVDVADPAAARATFRENVRPLLAERCLSCHGNDAAARKAGLRLDTFSGATRARRGGRAIVPGASERSLLIDRVTAGDPEHRMPPAGSGAPLTDEEVDVLRRWIDESGATYARHWSLDPPVAKTPPQLPASSTDFVRSEIDAFVLARMQEHGLRPSEPAEALVLARRASLDLTGLPPDPTAADRFASDPTDEAWARYVDGLLASPRFGERWARVWLDLARYADSMGYEKDGRRSIWPYLSIPADGRGDLHGRDLGAALGLFVVLPDAQPPPSAAIGALGGLSGF